MNTNEIRNSLMGDTGIYIDLRKIMSTNCIDMGKFMITHGRIDQHEFDTNAKLVSVCEFAVEHDDHHDNKPFDSLNDVIVFLDFEIEEITRMSTESLVTGEKVSGRDWKELDSCKAAWMIFREKVEFEMQVNGDPVLNQPYISSEN